MKYVGIILVIFIVIAFFGVPTSITGKPKVCERSENGFWRRLDKINTDTDIASTTDVDTLLWTKTLLQSNYNEVEILCDTVDSNIDNIYKEKSDAIQSRIDFLQDQDVP